MACALPFAGLMDLLGGFYFGWVSFPIALVSVTVGSIIPFSIAKYYGGQSLEKYEINKQKIILANEATKLLHGEKEAKIAEETALKTFQDRSTGEGLPLVKIAEKELNNIDIVSLIILSNLESSKSEVKRIIKKKTLSG